MILGMPTLSASCTAIESMDCAKAVRSESDCERSDGTARQVTRIELRVFSLLQYLRGLRCG
jgi:hypothetical protein